MTLINWQETLDDLFPYGAAVTQVEDVPEGVGFDDSPQFLTPRFVVLVDDEHPTVTCQILGIDKDITFTLMKLEEFSPGVQIVHTPDEEPDFLLSTNLDDEVKNSLRTARKEWYEEDEDE